MAREVGLMTIASTILGTPDETPESAWDTVNFIQEIKPDDVGYYIATPYPGTPMYDFVKEKGWLKVTDFNKYDTATPIFESPTISMKELREIREKAFQKFYLHPSYVLRMFGKGGVYGYSASRTALAHLRRSVRSKLKKKKKDE
jgi:radical SAM superfamily enzyme YgiQ (UPF0313 family)